ncbi:Hsp20 family protein [Terrilactibacillus sp. BCM23-1]|uniref:Hsp20 family protein n=1 Tax=Terrilactibacillus tamarindi TaxID=2599694 RepID=A0A6N8CPT7_9BACI|nr:Hsp20/alpha crystallin family protein [Terrilactibacillus tamarindi]MTT30915.1 Hsp20 family protein [Terrilactibacillus tamarindi]
MDEQNKEPENKLRKLPPKPFHFSQGLLGRMDEFFKSEPYRGILDSIDSFFQGSSLKWTSFPVDVYETESEWVVDADLPGVDRQNIHIEMLGDRLRITVIQKEETNANHDAEHYYYHERRMQQSSRTIYLPYTIVKQRTKATFRNGKLQIRGPKYPKTNNTLTIED